MPLLIAGAWSFAEAILFFIVADVPISWIAVRWGWRRGTIAALAAALGAALGGGLLYAWAVIDPVGSTAAIAALPGIDAAMTEATAGDFARSGYWAMLQGSVSGIPYKLYASAAGEQGWPLLPFLLATPLVRLPRFLAAALAAAAISHGLSTRLSMRARLRILAGFWILFYAVYFALMPR